MMVMRRKEGEKILIGDDIVIHIAHVGRNRVKVAIEAPRDVRVVAEEIQRVSDENTIAVATQRTDIIQLLSRLQVRSA